MATPRSAHPATPLTPTTPRALASRRSLAASSSHLPLTPSRPFTAPYLPPPLPPLALRPLPPRPYADDPDFDAHRQRDRDAIDYAIKLTRDREADRVKDTQGALDEIDEEKRRLDEATRALADKAREIAHGLARERDEADDSRRKDQEVERRARELKVQLDVVRADIAEVQAKLAARRALKLKQRDAFQRQALKNAPELAFFEDKLGLKVRGRARDVVMFKFCHIDQGAYTRSFAFELDASKPSYSLASLSPPNFLPPAVTTPLLDALNASRDLYAFVLEMRAAFRDEVRVEKLGLGEEAERDDARRRLRLERGAK